MLRFGDRFGELLLEGLDVGPCSRFLVPVRHRI
jgi:hypothetical protein